jgi:hypothetical protein
LPVSTGAPEIKMFCGLMSPWDIPTQWRWGATLENLLEHPKQPRVTRNKALLALVQNLRERY